MTCEMWGVGCSPDIISGAAVTLRYHTASCSVELGTSTSPYLLQYTLTAGQPCQVQQSIQFCVCFVQLRRKNAKCALLSMTVY